MDLTPAAWPAALPSGVCHGRQACSRLLAELLCSLAPPAGGVEPVGLPTQLLLVDTDFAAWPLDQPAVLAALAHWLRPAGRGLQLIATDFDAVARLHPRLARWRRDWAHRIAAWRPVDGLPPAGLRGLMAGPVALQWLDAPDWRLRPITEAVHLRALHEQCADFLQRCEPSWPVTTLGL